MAYVSRAFTLIELLVVVAIIVLLLVLLTPALEKAVYHAELLRCAGKLHATANGLIQYAFDHQRQYPERGVRNLARGQTTIYLPAMGLAYPLDNFDSRPPLRGIFSIDAMLQCPFSRFLPMDNTPQDVAVEASYMLLWGWQYKPPAGALRGMFKVGDRFEWTQAGVTTAYNLLICDMDLQYNTTGMASSHPDREPATMSEQIFMEAPVFSGRTNFSRWRNLTVPLRGLLDLNFAYDDGSVRQLTQVTGWTRQDERVDRIPLQYDIRRGNDQFEVPTP